MQQKWPLAQVSAGHMPEHVLGTETLRLLAHVLDQFGPLNSFREARKVFDQRGDRQLPARFVAFNDEWLKVGARSV